MKLTRRHALLAGAALPLAAPPLLRPRAAVAQQMQPATPNLPLSRSFQVGDMTVSALLAGAAEATDPHEIFGLNVDDATFEEVSQENFVPADRATFFFLPSLVSAGENLVLFDTGMQAGGLLAALEAAGVAPGDVTHVVLTHMHPDHIGGMTDDAGNPTFPEAALITGQAEYDFWAAQDDELFNAKVRPFAERFAFVQPGDSPVSGITAVEAFGHTPGHMAWRLDSGDQGLLLIADTANHYVWSLAHPDWEVLFDADKEQAAQTRREILGMLASERMPMLGYHMPFPGVGYVEAAGDGFRYVPHSYQLL